MKQNVFHIIFMLLLCTASAFAQLDSIQQLPEVMLTDAKLVQFSKGFKLEKLNDSVIERNSSSLTETLRYNSSIYFKENGFGMVSSPSFRGTNAAQTAVIWNGININSVFTGQIDFNTISPLNYNEIAIRSGGGGVQYGSGAVGGSIHLNNSYSFKKIDTTKIGLRYGSFSSLGGNASTTQTWGDHYLNVGVDFISSENDYDYVGKNKTNNHGQFVRFSAKVNEARKLKRGVATWNSEYTYNDRNFSGSLNTNGRDAYKDIATRNLWQLQRKLGVFNTKASVAHLFEQYNYFPDSEKPFSTGGKANTFIGAFQSEILLQKKLRINGKVEYTYVDAEGENVGDNSRKTFAAVVLLNHKLSEKFNYGINLRQEFLNDFDNPLLFSADAKYSFSKNYILRLNGSKNYRIPTFNDLYWYAGGNFELKPETSYQIELGQEFSVGKLKADVAAYYISSKDLIKWIPGNGGLWQPENINKTRNYGVEVTLDYSLKFSKTQSLSINGNYSYTKAEDLEKEKQLIYVPFHKAAGSMKYNLKNFSAYIQGLFNGEAYTTTDNSEIVDSYAVLNFGAQYTLPFNPNITFGGRLKNVFNVYYENVAYRPMPSRNFEIFLNLNI
ncbi:outer membrane cobalamin receptor protein [Aequorivita sublithincola DSM 14238]|uniref:Outer membrane cobalamin receptor protein n=1 Tax=Aequorivita sublithincola (strain DSM 14238 / LMG 21431 / ACAM 643 / 9-3) TaxID=746697 RepID=I3YZM2_AEQSU|nr:TonB-dependent receptor [Aequorivita sublithincola]AFL82440.1 outer membrane cobalamin receptor protein [Aequorivita sublithincola DSM 14238]